MLFTNIYYKKPVASYSRLVFLLGLFFFFSIPTQAADGLKLSTSVDYVFYREFSEKGETLNTETGYLPGFQLSFHYAISSDLHVYSEAYYGASTIKYDGQLQSGDPYKTDSKMIKTHFKMGVDQYFQQHQFGLFLGKDTWDRHILSSYGIPQLSEYYYWDSFGFKYGFNAETLKIGAELSRLFNAGLDVDFIGQGYGVLHAAMPNGTSASLSVGFDINEYLSGWWLTSTLSGHYFARGKTTFTNNRGITEPENITLQLGVHLSYLFKM